jgi:hypothetical protein
MAGKKGKNDFLLARLNFEVPLLREDRGGRTEFHYQTNIGQQPV